MTEVIQGAPRKARPELKFSLSLALLVVGVLLIGASLLPIGEWVAKSRWSTENSAEFDRISNEYKLSNYKSPARAGVSQAEWEAQRGKMQQRMQALQEQLDQAKLQPKRWSRYLLVFGTLLTAAGFYANANSL